jgi:catechol 2,3-dioxygenase-like lactoylglutathione lyase family enzyme
MNPKLFAGIDHIAMQLPDLGEGLRFFHDLLGFKVRLQAEFEEQKIVMLKAGKIEIELWEGKNEGKIHLNDSDYGVHHLAVQVKNLDSVIACMKKRHVKILADIYEPTRGIREAIVQGPGGVRVQFVEQNVPLLIWRTIKGDFRES